MCDSVTALALVMKAADLGNSGLACHKGRHAGEDTLSVMICIAAKGGGGEVADLMIQTGQAISTSIQVTSASGTYAGTACSITATEHWSVTAPA